LVGPGFDRRVEIKSQHFGGNLAGDSRFVNSRNSGEEDSDKIGTRDVAGSNVGGRVDGSSEEEIDDEGEVG